MEVVGYRERLECTGNHIFKNLQDCITKKVSACCIFRGCIVNGAKITEELFKGMLTSITAIDT